MDATISKSETRRQAERHRPTTPQRDRTVQDECGEWLDRMQAKVAASRQPIAIIDDEVA